ncbi:MAG: hypothetical protein VCD66_17485 [Alphaproteobacteria bacterium]|jgi:hypothetical protein
MLRILVAAAIALAPALAQAQQVPCGERDKNLSKLGKDYAEQPVSVGLSSNGTLVEVLASKSGSWTMIVTQPDGGSCVIATGQSWEDLTKKAGRPAA